MIKKILQKLLPSICLDDSDGVECDECTGDYNGKLIYVKRINKHYSIVTFDSSSEDVKLFKLSNDEYTLNNR